MRLTLIMIVVLLVFAVCSDGVAGGDQPPAATARSGATSVAVGLGSYCWTSGGAGLCADSPGIVTGTEDLEVSRGEAVTIGGAFAQTEFALEDARIRPIEGEAAEEAEEWRMWTPTMATWPSEWSALELEAVDGGLRLIADLPAGRYLVSLALSFPQGDAGYGLILDIR
ncbi:MAG TPA: hypothetical protein QGI71_06000 [Dehalococcoidia bacterium]|jgi:hypothetical protein|nr:hypothetical protein [Dehalococcoidia bacterium]